MTTSLRFVCELPTGLHARPASLLAETARRFHAAVAVTNEATGVSAEGRSVLSIIALDVQRGQSVLVEAFGDDSSEFLAAVEALVHNHFGESLTSAPALAAGPAVRVPPPFQRLGIAVTPGRAVCEGLGHGAAVVVGGLDIPEAVRHARTDAPDEEWARAADALESVRDEIDEDLHATRDVLRAELLRAHLGIVDDPALRKMLEQSIRSGKAAPCAVVEASAHFMSRFGASASAYIRERAADVEDICRRILGKLDPALLRDCQITLSGPSVVVADSLGVSQLMALDPARLAGLVLGDVGSTSHVVILARSMRIPTVIAVEGAARAFAAGAPIVVDAYGGFAVAASAPVSEYYRRERVFRERRLARIRPLLDKRGATRDGVGIEVAANAATPAEIRAAMSAGADSIGLLRTELLFLDRAEAPTEQEQYEVYRAAVEAAGKGREVIIRTLDIGGDKPAPYISVPEEDNPFLGCRGLRLYYKYPDLLRAQLRAICRASAHGAVKVMAPMVATLAEARWFRERIASVQAELAAERLDHDPALPVGIMVEVPSVATIIDQLAKVVDFISIGTNDLGQYWFAADRTNKAVASLASVRDPSFLRLLEQIVAAARTHKLWAGLCGEMAGDPLNLPLLIGLGLSEISAAAPSIGPIKTQLAGFDAAHGRELLAKALRCDSHEDVTALLTEFAATHRGDAHAADPVHADLVLIDSDAATKEHAIQDLVGALHAAGRADDPRAVEDAIWAREATYATNLGFGFAIPHCRTDAVGCPSIAVAKLRSPVDWGSGGAADGQPVRVVLMLTVRASDADQTHLKLLVKLARRLMHEGFRDSLLGASDVDTILHTLRTELELGA